MTRAAGFRSFQIPSTGMEPTIRQGDRIVADMRYYRVRSPNRFETVLFKRGDIFYIKRVIAVGGDVIESRNQLIFLNGQQLDEQYVEHIGDAPEWANTFGPTSVPSGQFFVMGDNRDYSLDSRSPDHSLVGSGSIVGKPLYLFSGRIFASERDGSTIP